jgi:hypothetical protein
MEYVAKVLKNTKKHGALSPKTFLKSSSNFEVIAPLRLLLIRIIKVSILKTRELIALFHLKNQ